MWKRAAFVLVLAGLVVWTGCGGGGGTPPDQVVTGDEAVDVLDDGQDVFDAAKDEGMNDADATDHLANWLRSRPEIHTAAVTDDPSIVEFEYVDGTPGLFFTGEAWCESDVEGGSIAGDEVELFAQQTTHPQPAKQTAIVLDAFPHFFNRTPTRVKTMLSGIGYDVTYLSEQEVALSRLRQLSQYGVVFINTHGGASNGQVVLLTGERMTDENWETYSTWRTSGKIGAAGHSGQFFWDKTQWYFVSPKFFEDVNACPRSVFYAHACHSLDNNSMSNALRQRGLGAYCGWMDTVWTVMDSGVPRRFFQEMCACKTVHDADIQDGTPRATYRGDGDIVLALEPLKIAASEPGYDDVASVAGELGYAVDTIPLHDITTSHDLDGYACYAINCAEGLETVSPTTTSALRDYVQEGGRVYMSDFAFAVLQGAFPGKMTVPSDPYCGESGYVTANVVDPALRAYLGAPSVELHFDLSEWVPISSVGSGVTVLLEGTYACWNASQATVELQSPLLRRNAHAAGPSAVRPTASATGPLALSFEHGTGKVVYTSFHYHTQLTATQRALLEYLILY